MLLNPFHVCRSQTVPSWRSLRIRLETFLWVLGRPRHRRSDSWVSLSRQQAIDGDKFPIDGVSLWPHFHCLMQTIDAWERQSWQPVGFKGFTTWSLSSRLSHHSPYRRIELSCSDEDLESDCSASGAAIDHRRGRFWFHIPHAFAFPLHALCSSGC